MAKSYSKVLKASGFIILLLLMFGMWYKYQYSMYDVETKEINNPAEFSTHVLVATQGSEFKDAVLEKLIADLTVLESYIKVVDVSLLDNIKYKDWDAICVMHTWEQWKAPKSVVKFIDRLPIDHNVTFLTTSESSDSKMFQVDGITSASNLSEVESVADQLINSIKSAL